MSSMAKLTTLKSGLPRLGLQVKTLDVRAGATQRTRGSAWMKIRARQLREHPLCAMCHSAGKVTAANRVDHVVPLWEGGADDESNYQSLCIQCHDVKTAEEAKRRGQAWAQDAHSAPRLNDQG